MHLDLFLPGLLWPGEATLPLTRDLELTALSALLGRATLRFESGANPAAALGALFGLTEAPLPLAALRRLGEAIAPAAAPAAWLCLDPVNLSFTREHLLLSALPGPLSLPICRPGEHRGGRWVPEQPGQGDLWPCCGWTQGTLQWVMQDPERIFARENFELDF